MIKITYELTSEGLKKPEKTTINIYRGQMYIQYNVAGKAKSVVQQMQKDGYKNVMYARGAMLQIFPNKTEDEILEIARKDIKNGLYVAKEKTGKEFKIENYNEDKQ